MCEGREGVNVNTREEAMEGAVAAAAFDGRNRSKNAAQLAADVAALAQGLRSCILWDYPQVDGSAAAQRVASALRASGFPEATSIVIDGAPFVLPSRDELRRRRDPTFAVLEGDGAPRWATAVETHAFADALQQTCEALADILASPSPPPSINLVEGLEGRGLSPASLFGWLLDYPCIYAFADGEAAARALSGSESVVYRLEATCSSDGKTIEGHRFAVPAVLAGASFESILRRRLDNLRATHPHLQALDYPIQPPVAGTVAF